jgi:hypothetical protein
MREVIRPAQRAVGRSRTTTIVILALAFPAPHHETMEIAGGDSMAGITIMAGGRRRAKMTKNTNKRRPATDRKNETMRGNTGAKRNRPGGPRLTSQHKLELARRRARVAEMVGEGKSVRDCEELLRSEGFQHCDHVTVAKDLKLE